MDVCVICKISDGSDIIQLGLDTINKASLERKDNIYVKIGDYVHKKYRKDYIHGTLNRQHLEITIHCCDIQNPLQHHLIFKRIASFVHFQLLQQKNKIKLLRVSNLVFVKLIRKYWLRLAIEVMMIGH